MKFVIGDVKLDHKKHLPKRLVKYPIRTLSSVLLISAIIGGAWLWWYIKYPMSGQAVEDRYLHAASISETCIYCGGSKTYSQVVEAHTYRLNWNKYFSRRFHISVAHRYHVCETCKVLWVSRLNKEDQEYWDRQKGRWSER